MHSSPRTHGPRAVPPGAALSPQPPGASSRFGSSMVLFQLSHRVPLLP